MELHPRDLGMNRYLAVLHRRLTPMTPQGVPATPTEDIAAEKPLGGRGKRLRERVRRYWLKDLKVDDTTGEKVANILSKGTAGIGMRVGLVIVSIYLLLPAFIMAMAHVPFPFLLTILIAWALAFSLILAGPRKALRQAHEKPLTTTEIEAMLPAARGRLERNYLQLVLDAMHQDVPSASAQGDIKAALRDLGDAISRLPADSVPVPNSAALRQEADHKRKQAALENDSFIRASLVRQAETLDRRAAVGDENGVVLRRLSILRREARTQMDALRSVLVAFSNTSQIDASTAGHLTEALSRAAGEAQAVAIARRELEDEEIASLFGGPVPAPQPQVQQQVVAPPPPVQQTQPQPQVVQSRHWWRNNGGTS
jgi:hypothetical protein